MRLSPTVIRVPAVHPEYAPARNADWENEGPPGRVDMALDQLARDRHRIGDVLGSFRTTAPNDSWVIANGQAISRTKYAAAFAFFGTTYGSGDGSTTFNIPDLRGLSLIGTS